MVFSFDFELLGKRIRREKDRRIFAKVFDAKTFDAIQYLASRNHFDVLEHIISTGKEAHVFVATDLAGNLRAVKIYKKQTTDFKSMSDYILGDKRFKEVRKEINSLISLWAKKEFSNLVVAMRAGLNSPFPVAFKDNVVVMEFIGSNGNPALRLKDVGFVSSDAEDYYSQVVYFVAKLYLSGLIHADLSEYNILVQGKKLWFIDFAQAVLHSHPMAKFFFERGILNMSSYFSKHGFKVSFEKMLFDVKAKKDELASGIK
ncbi:MAG: serine protein kinase RIO [Candidatus Diapherotrites archaeon]